MGRFKLLFLTIFLCSQVLRLEAATAAFVPALEEEFWTDLDAKHEAPLRRAFQHFANTVKRAKLHQFYGLMGKRDRDQHGDPPESIFMEDSKKKTSKCIM